MYIGKKQALEDEEIKNKRILLVSKDASSEERQN